MLLFCIMSIIIIIIIDISMGRNVLYDFSIQFIPLIQLIISQIATNSSAQHTHEQLIWGAYRYDSIVWSVV